MTYNKQTKINTNKKSTNRLDRYSWTINNDSLFSLFSIYSPKTLLYAQVGTAKEQKGHQVYYTFVRYTVRAMQDW